jgi:hypothetical protein
MLQVKDVGKPDEGKPHVRFDEGLVGKFIFPTNLLYRQVFGRKAGNNTA